MFTNVECDDVTAGPDHWHETYEHCDDDHQSPIDIHVEDAEEDDHLHDFHLHHFEDDDLVLTLHNTGHTGKSMLTY